MDISSSNLMNSCRPVGQGAEAMSPKMFHERSKNQTQPFAQAPIKESRHQIELTGRSHSTSLEEMIGYRDKQPTVFLCCCFSTRERLFDQLPNILTFLPENCDLRN